MRILAIIALSLVTAVAVFVAGFALLHGIEAPEREMSSDTSAPVIPEELITKVEPIDRQDRHVMFGKAVDASTRQTYRLRGNCDVQDAKRLILCSLSSSSRVLSECTVDANGAFEFEALPRGVYELRVVGERGAPLRVLDKVELFSDRKLEITGVPNFRVRVEILSDGQAVPKAFCILTRDGRRIATGTSDAEGAFNLDALSAGSIEWRIWVNDVNTGKTGEWRGQTEIRATDTKLSIELPKS